jgi:uncharacterized protein YeaC (DUF1315 family)
MLNNRIVPHAYPFANVEQITSPSENIPWTSLPRPDVRDPRFARLDRKHLVAFKNSYHYLTLDEEAKKCVDSLITVDLDPLAVTSNNDLSTRLDRMEMIRGSIPAEGLLQYMLAALHRGQWPDGTPLASQERVKLTLALFNKSIADAKNVDSELVQERAKREQLAKDAKKDEELRNLSRDELLLRLKELEK